MKKLSVLVYFTILLFWFKAGNAQTFKKGSEIKINYNVKNLDFSVKASWKPLFVKEGIIVGSAEIEIKKNSEKQFTKLKVENFGIDIKKIVGVNFIIEKGEEIYKRKILGFSNNNLVLKYDQNEINDLIDESTKNFDDGFFHFYSFKKQSFWFQDINFDGVYEFILNKHFSAQREMDQFIVFDNQYGNFQPIVTYPQIEIDGYTRIDFKFKSLYLYWSNGICANSNLIFKLNENSTWELKEMKKEFKEDPFSDSPCQTKNYFIKNIEQSESNFWIFLK